MDLINALAEYFQVTNDKIEVVDASGNIVWFTVCGVEHTCKTVRGGKYLKKHSIR